MIETLSNNLSSKIQAMAITRVVLSPVVGGPNDNAPLISKERKFTGIGSDTDIVTSSARAYTSALNKLLSWSMRRQAQEDGTLDDHSAGNAIAVPTHDPSVVGSN